MADNNHGKKILLLDDEQSVLKLYADYLSLLKYQVLTAENGEAGLEIMKKENPDLFLVDLRMPGIGGLDFLEYSNKSAPDTPKIVISGTDSINDVVQALKYGATDYLIKPLADLSILGHTVEKALEKAHLTKDNKTYQTNLESLVRERTAELEQANSELADVNHRLKSVVETTRGLSTCTYVSDLAHTMLEEFAKHMQARGGSLFLIEDGGLRRYHTLDQKHVPEFIPFPLTKKSILLRGIVEKKPMLISDISNEKSLNSSGWNGYKDTSTLVFPLPDENGTIVGILTLHSKKNPPFVEQDKEIGSILASYGCESLRAARSVESLRKSENRFRELANLLPEAVVETDAEMNLLFANQKTCDLFGYTQKDFEKGLNGVDLIANKEKKKALTNSKKRKEGSRLGAVEYTAVKKDGSTFPILLHMNPIKKGKLIEGFRGIIVDISGRKQAEMEIKNSEERLKALFEHAPDAYYLNDLKGIIIDGNRAAEKLLGFKKNELVGKNFKELNILAKKDLPKAMTALARNTLGKASGPSEFTLYNKAGKEVEVEILTQPIKLEGKTTILGMARDVTERKKAEIMLQKSEEKFRSLVEDIGVGIGIVNLSESFIFSNAEADKIFGIRSGTLVGHSLLDFLDTENKALINNQNLIRKKGEKNQYQLTIQSLDKKTKYLDVTASPHLDDTGKHIGTLGFFHDITEQKVAEQEKQQLEQQLRRSQKMETIGTLAGGIAHDFNNILAPILGYTEMAMMRLDQNDPLQNDLERVIKAAYRASDLVEQILLFSKKSEKQRESLSIQSIVREALKLLRPSIPTTIDIKQDINENCPLVRADATQIHQVIMNLCTNAWQAMEEKGGILKIELQQLQIDKSIFKMYPGLSEGNYARLSVIDSGPGMNEEILERIFEPFFTTKTVDKGTGLGLSVVHGIVRSHKGDIQVQSKPGDGTTFHVFLPTVKSETKRDHSKSQPVIGGTENILIVDDEKPVAELVKRMLENLGYNAIVYNDGSEALEAFRQQSSRFDLLISDLTMPQLTGLDLADEIHSIRKDFPVVIMTGYGASLTKPTQEKYGVGDIVKKPVTMKSLASAIRKTLDNHNSK